MVRYGLQSNARTQHQYFYDIASNEEGYIEITRLKSEEETKFYPISCVISDEGIVEVFNKAIKAEDIEESMLESLSRLSLKVLVAVCTLNSRQDLFSSSPGLRAFLLSSYLQESNITQSP